MSHLNPIQLLSYFFLSSLTPLTAVNIFGVICKIRICLIGSTEESDNDRREDELFERHPPEGYLES
jgi:hypothetical protein